MLINHASRQVTAKIVYYGPGLGGKTTNLQYIFSVTSPRSRGELVSMETEIERTLFFDLLPMNVGMIRGYQTRFQLYTVPGQVFYDSTRKLVLRGADGIVFVADSQEMMIQANVESLSNLRENLLFYEKRLDDIPLVFQYNKRDLKNITPVEKLNQDLNALQRPHLEAIAREGKGVIETLREISSHTLLRIKESLEQMEMTPTPLRVEFDLQPPAAVQTREKVAAAEPRHIHLHEEAATEPALALLVRREVIVLKDSRLAVEIKDGKGQPLSSLNLEVPTQIRQIQIILDVTK